jgi:hypothetical protein
MCTSSVHPEGGKETVWERLTAHGWHVCARQRHVDAQAVEPLHGAMGSTSQSDVGGPHAVRPRRTTHHRCKAERCVGLVLMPRMLVRRRSLPPARRLVLADSQPVQQMGQRRQTRKSPRGRERVGARKVWLVGFGLHPCSRVPTCEAWRCPGRDGQCVVRGKGSGGRAGSCPTSRPAEGSSSRAWPWSNSRTERASTGLLLVSRVVPPPWWRTGSGYPNRVRCTGLTAGARNRRHASAPRWLCWCNRRGSCLPSPGQVLGWAASSRPILSYAFLLYILDLCPPHHPCALGRTRPPTGLHPQAPLEGRAPLSCPGVAPQRRDADPRRLGSGGRVHPPPALGRRRATVAP